MKLEQVMELTVLKTVVEVVELDSKMQPTEIAKGFNQDIMYKIPQDKLEMNVYSFMVIDNVLRIAITK